VEAVTLAGRDRLWRAREAIAAWGLGSWLLALLVFAGLFAAFNNGATSIPQESRLQVGIAATGLVCGVGVAAGALSVGRGALAWAGVALLAGFALWSALSAAWSAAPDETWIAANRAIAYVVVLAVAIVAAASARSAQRGVALGIAAAALVVALYALGGKIVPGLHIGAFDLNPGDEFSRVREPIGYWNAVGILCVMATPVCIWLAAFPDAPDRVRIGASLALTVFVLTTATTYSRGAMLAYIAVLAVMVGAGPQRLRRLAIGVIAIVAALPSMVLVFGLHDLSAGGLSLHDRESGGAILGLVLLLSLAALALAGRELLRVEQRVRWTPAQSRRIWRAMGVAVLASLVVGVGAVSVSSRGLTGEISHQIDNFKEPKAGPGNDPSRLISSNGSNRWIWWQEALGAFSDKPLAGWGAGSFPVVRYLYRRYDAPVRSTHSVPLQFLSETGLVGSALGLGGLGLLGAAAVRRVRRSSGIERSARLALLAAATAWGVHSLIDWDWEIPAVTIPALVALAVAAAPLPRGGRRPVRRRPAPAALAAASAVAAGLLVASAALPSMSQTKRVESLRDAGRGSLREGASDADLAKKLNPLSVEPLFAEAGIARSRGDEAWAGSLLVEATKLQPDNFETWQRLAQFELSVGDYQAAARAIRHQAVDNPLAFEARPNIADLLFPLEAPPERSPTAFGTPPP
jgi:O-antigen ligase/polysaccharide polymerase Wzy-like membrane protein